jgi:hypothetical protein
MKVGSLYGCVCVFVAAAMQAIRVFGTKGLENPSLPRRAEDAIRKLSTLKLAESIDSKSLFENGAIHVRPRGGR